MSEPTTGIELPALGKSRTFWSSDATPEELEICLSGDHPSLLYRVVQEREEQLLASLERERVLQAQLTKLKDDNEKLDDEVQCAMGMSGLQFHLMRRMGLECIELDKWINVRAEAAESQLRELREIVGEYRVMHVFENDCSGDRCSLCIKADLFLEKAEGK